MSSSLIKSYNVNFSSEKDKKTKRVIDSNQAVSERIKTLSELLEAVPEEDFADEFSEGLDAAQVDALLTDQDELVAEEARNEAAQKLIDDANEQAQQILNDANEQAQQILSDTNEQIKALEEEALKRGHEEGVEKGYAEGLAKASELERQAEEKSAALDEAYEAKVAELEPKFVEVLTDIYSHVLGIDLSGRSEVVLNLLRDAIRNVEGTKNFLVHVAKEDHEFVSANRDKLAEGLGTAATIEIIEDITLSPGSSFIETDGGIYDCSLGTELELLKKELRILSYTEK